MREDSEDRPALKTRPQQGLPPWLFAAVPLGVVAFLCLGCVGLIAAIGWNSPRSATSSSPPSTFEKPADDERKLPKAVLQALKDNLPDPRGLKVMSFEKTDNGDMLRQEEEMKGIKSKVLPGRYLSYAVTCRAKNRFGALEIQEWSVSTVDGRVSQVQRIDGDR